LLAASCSGGGNSGASSSPRLSVPASTSASPPLSFAETVAAVQQRMDVYQGIASGVVTLVRVGDQRQVITQGLADLPNDRPMNDDSRFAVSGASIPILSTAVMQLVEAHAVALDDTVEHWLPGLLPQGERITVDQVLSHRSGLYDYFNGDPLNLKHLYSPRELVRIVARHPMAFPPGSSYGFSAANLLVLGLIVEEASHTPLEAFLDKHVFGPAGMTAASLEDHYPIGPTMTRGYDGDRDVTLENLSVIPGGNVVATVGDLDKFLAALLDGRLVGPELVNEMTKPISQIPFGNQTAGRGLTVRPVDCGTAVGIDGQLPGLSMQEWQLEDRDRAVVVMVNDRGSQDIIDGIVSAALCG